MGREPVGGADGLEQTELDRRPVDLHERHRHQHGGAVTALFGRGMHGRRSGQSLGLGPGPKLAGATRPSTGLVFDLAGVKALANCSWIEAGVVSVVTTTGMSCCSVYARTGPAFARWIESAA